ncbi:MAG: OmpA family protein, partial [Pseudomonadota bacterium]
VIEDLGARLNQALAQKVDELQRYRSEFFGRLRDVIGSRNDIQIVGDRFVFQSEVLFSTGSAELGAAGRRELSRFAGLLRDISSDIPPEVSWILRIDGHTDRVPITGGIYRNNWELSQARALSVVEFLINQENIPPQRLAATGFGEYQPIDPGNTREAFARNRRIELKLTER